MTSFELMALIDAFGDAKAIVRAYRSAWAKRSGAADDSALLVEELDKASLGKHYTELGQPGHELLFHAWQDGRAPRKIRWKIYRHTLGEAVSETLP